MGRSNRIEIERSLSQEPWDMPQMHAHRFHEMYMLISGKRRYFIEHAIYDLAPGELVLIPSSQLHRTVATGDDSHERYLIYFDETVVGQLLELVGQEAFLSLMQSHCLQLPPDITRQIRRDLEQLEREQRAPDGYTEAVSVHLLEDILLLALRHGKKKPPVSGESADKIQQIAQYVAEHYAEELTLPIAASMVFMEQTYFSRRFKQLTGVGFQEYLTRTRLRAAEQLLERTALPVGQIAEVCGFSGSNYFGDVFRKWKGMSPTVYRKRFMEETER